jgi:signal transduction histidine kinase
MLLLLAQLDSSNQISRKPVLLTTLIEQGETGIYLEKNAKNLTVIATYPPEPLYTMGDPDQLRQMLYFLLENAVRFTPRDGTLTLRLYSEESYAVIEVNDTGIGIAQEAMNYIFEPFWRQDEARTESGFGLGLPISRRIAEQHDGSIELSSMLNEGTTVLVRLPLVVPQEKRHEDRDTPTTT